MMEFICKKWELLVMMFTSEESANLIDSACILFPRVKAAFTDADSPLLRLYLTVIQESTRPLNALCYTVEGDQACLPLCYIALLRRTRQFIDCDFSTLNLPETTAVLLNFPAARHAELKQTMAGFLQPGKFHFINTFFGRPGVVPAAHLAAGHVSYEKGLSGMFDFYSAVSLCDPAQMQKLSAVDRTKDVVRSVMQCTQYVIDGITTIDHLVNELPFYLQVLAGTPVFTVTLDDLDERTEVIRVFWQTYKMSLPHWYAFWDLMIIQSPSTGCVERVFSEFTNMYGAQQHHMMADTIALYVMLRYNRMGKHVS